MSKTRSRIFLVVTYLSHALLGFLVLLLMIAVFLLLVPLFIYRVLVLYVLSPMFKRFNGEILTGLGQPMATDFLKKHENSHVRCTVVPSLIADGTIDKELATSIIQSSWIEARDKKTGKLLYPELQQYIVSWFGFMFWKEDKQFDINNHLHFIDLEESMTPTEAKNFAEEFMENLINIPFKELRSPWEVFFIYNYMDPNYITDSLEPKKTLVLLRHHHALADGNSAFRFICTTFFRKSASEVKLVQSVKAKHPRTSFTRILKTPFDFLRDLGKFSLLLFPEKTPWHCPDERKSGKQFYCISQPIPIKKIKQIKNKVHCSFVSVLLSCASAGIVHSFRKFGFQSRTKTLPIGMPVPLPGSPEHLGNYLSGVAVELPIDENLDSMERLYQAERALLRTKRSKNYTINTLALACITRLVAPLSRMCFQNRMCAYLSCVPTSRIPMDIRKSSVLAIFGGQGGMYGNTGVAFSVISYCDQVYIMLIAESAVMGKNDLKEMLNVIYDEIDILHKLCPDHKPLNEQRITLEQIC